MTPVRLTETGVSLTPNAYVNVRLTEAGNEILRRHNAENRLPETAIDILFPKSNNGRRFQLSDLMLIFGDEMAHGNPNWPFVGDIYINLLEQPS